MKNIKKLILEKSRLLFHLDLFPPWGSRVFILRHLELIPEGFICQVLFDPAGVDPVGQRSGLQLLEAVLGTGEVVVDCFEASGVSALQIFEDCEEI